MMKEMEASYIYNDDREYELRFATGATKKLKSKEEIEEYALNPANPLPELHGGKTWLSNYVLTFWFPLMKPMAFGIYVQLIKMAFGEKEFAFPTGDYLAMMMGVSKRTVQTHMRELQDMNFVVVIHVKDKKTGADMQNLYLISKTIPFLTENEIEKLHPKLQEEHAKFIEGIKTKKLFI